jgi:CheY-like chemotaxis protein
LHESAELLSGLLPDTIELSFCLAEPDVTVSANRGQIRQVILNLCNNARESIGKRDGTIHIEAGRLKQTEFERIARLQPSAENHFSGKLDLALDYVFIRVSDNGSGIPPDVLKRIFDPFFTTKGRRRGTGLGLSVVHSVVESHGGFVIVETTPDRGTTFSVLLPAHQEPAEFRGSEPRGQVTIGRERILIVDDKFDVADSLAISFERLGYDALALTDPRDALQALSEDPGSWQVLITDHVMPEMDGTILIARAKRLVPNIVAILCTGCTSEEAQHCPEMDLQFYKPISPAEIARAMRRILDERGPSVQTDGRAVA